MENIKTKFGNWINIGVIAVAGLSTLSLSYFLLKKYTNLSTILAIVISVLLSILVVYGVSVLFTKKEEDTSDNLDDDDQDNTITTVIITEPGGSGTTGNSGGTWIATTGPISAL
jgi:membrane protein implicated in regulation of membrane protease activity